MSRKPAAVAFDVVETLISLEPLGDRFVEIGLPREAVWAWFPRTLVYGIGMSVVGDYVPFPTAAAEALRALTRYEISEDAVAHVLAGVGELPAHPDVEPAMRHLAENGIRMICLTNGTAAMTQAFLDRCGLAGYVEQVVATAELKTWKPPARVYLHGAAVLDLPPERVALVAVHAWDCHAAKRAGLMAGWAARLEGRYGEIFVPADVVGRDLVEVAQALVAAS
ncbi:MAG: haloacid dehalogenase type II [Sporichthyaceae bacterium]